MSARGLGAAIAVAGLWALLGGLAAAQDAPLFDAAETRQILRHGPWPPPVVRDPSNRASGDPAAIALGQRLFSDARLSSNGAIACATCHVPARGWADGRAKARGLEDLDRNTPTLLNVALQRWFSWDGRADSLWSQSRKPIVDPREMGSSAHQVADVVRGDPELSCLYARAFGARPASGGPDEDDGVLVDAGKSLAAFLEGVRSGRTPFDELRDALAQGDRAAAASYPAAARRGLRIFVGAGRCHVCHVGPAFTNGEFHDVGVPYMAGPGRVDSGRYGGIKQLLADPYNLLGPHSDDRSRASAIKTRHVELQQANFGQFRTPSLRNAAVTGPYMHDGRYATLRDVVRHYSELDVERLHLHGEQLLRPLKLSEAEIDDVVAFLETLTDPRAAGAPALVPSPCAP